VNFARPSDRRDLRAIGVALAVFAVSGALAVGQARWAVANLPRVEPLAELSYYPSGQWLGQAAVGEQAAWSDLLWLRAVQYYGLHRETDNTFVQMGHVFDIITTLDTRFQNAYVFGGTSLCQEGHQFDDGVKLLEKGARNNPTSWVYPFELGFVHYLGKRNLTRATFEFAQAARQPNSPDYCQRFAAWSGQRAGYEAVSVELWRQVAETTDNAVMREKAIEHLRELIRGTGEERHLEAWIRGLKPLVGIVPQAHQAGGSGS
jgi:tetratricopeptide (TPR) repeat protein